MATYEETTRSGRQICTPRYFGRAAMDNPPRGSTSQAEGDSIMANQVGHAPRWQCRLGYFSGGVGCPNVKKTNARETSERSAALGEPPLILRGGISPPSLSANKVRRNSWAATTLRQGRLCFRSVGFALSKGKNRHEQRDCAEGHLGSIADAFPSGGLTRAGGQEATFANQLRGVDAIAESPWTLTKKRPGANGKSA